MIDLTEQSRAKWVEIAPLIDTLARRSDTPHEFSHGPLSQLAKDDQASDPYHVSHAFRQCLMGGIDHLHAAKVLIVDAGQLHIAAPASLARGALENFAAAYWIIGPDSSVVRVERTLRWHKQNLMDQVKAQKQRHAVDAGRAERSSQLVNAAGATKVRDVDSAAMEGKILAVAKRNGVSTKDVACGYTSTAILDYAEAQISDLPLGVKWPWQICSGFAHGRPWAYLGVLNREVTDTADPGVASVRLTNDLTRAMYPTLAAMHFLERVLRKHQERAT